MAFYIGRCSNCVWSWFCDEILCPGGGGGGGGTHVFIIRWLESCIYCSPPKNIRNVKHPKKYLKFLNPPKNILIQEKTLKYIEITPKTSLILGIPKKKNKKKNPKFKNFEHPKLA